VNGDEESAVGMEQAPAAPEAAPQAPAAPSPQQPQAPMNEEGEMGRNPQPIDQPTNTHYAVNKKTGLIINAWEYDPQEYDPAMLRQFAKDYFIVDLQDNGFDPKEYKILTRKGCAAQGIDPSKNESWSNDGITPCKPRMSVNESEGISQRVANLVDDNSGEEGNSDKVVDNEKYHKKPFTTKSFNS
jgi:hypothetical protein